MKYTQILAAAAMASVASAHATLWEAIVDGVSGGVDGRGKYIRAPTNNSPLKDLTSTNLRCNIGGGTAVPTTIEAKAGSKITLMWHHDTAAPTDDTIDGSHKGPLVTYLAPTSSNGVGNVWVKIAEDGYSGGQWAVDRLKAASGAHTITLPSSLAPGEYLLRDEIIALHEGDVAYVNNPARGAQLYMGCVQLKVTSGGSATLPAGVAIPGVYTSTDPGIVFNLYSTYTSYPIPGPNIWNGVGGSAPAPAPANTLRTTTRPAAVATQAPAPVTTSKAPAPVTTSMAPAPVTTSNAPAPVTTSNAPAPVTTSNAPATVITTEILCGSEPTSAPAPPASGAPAAKYAQCGGIGFTAKACVSGTSCVKQNDWYSQCL